MPSGFRIACRIHTGQLLLFGRGTRQCLEIRNRGLLFYCCCFNALKYAHFWQKKEARLSLLITSVFPKDFTWCQGLWSSSTRPLSFFNTDHPGLSSPLLFTSSSFPFFKFLNNFPVWEKTRFHQNSSSFYCLSDGEQWRGRGESKRGESEKGRASDGMQPQGSYQAEERKQQKTRREAGPRK